MTEILFVRHGETDWNVEQRVQGHSDRPLNANGEAQARALADKLRDDRIDAVYASDLARARDTAAPVAEAHGLEVELLPGLREKDFGTWEGLLDTEIRERFPQANGGPLRAVLRHCSAGGDGHIDNCHVARIGIQDGAVLSLD